MSISLAIDKLIKDGLEPLAKSVAQERDGYVAEIDKLRGFVAQLQRAQFGPKSERLDPDQLQLAIEEMEQSAAGTEAAQEQAETQAEKPTRRKKPRTPLRGALPSHLPREHVTIEPEDKACPCCGGEMHSMGEDVSEQLDVVPAQFKVIATHRPKYGCRACEEAVVQAPAPERPITGGMATEATLAHVLIAKYCDHLPLYRQALIYDRQGVPLDRATLADWVGRACWWLKPLHQCLFTTVLASTKIFADDTPIPVLDPGRGKTKTGRFWAYGHDDRPWQGTRPPAVVYLYSDNRKGEHPLEHLAGFKGVLQVDGYASYKTFANSRADASVTLAYCWAHCRRKFFDVHKATDSPIAAAFLRRVAALYAIEAEIRGRPAEDRKAERQSRSKPLVEDLKGWLMERLGEISGKTKLAEYIRYVLGHWDGLCVFLEDGRVEMDTNTIERGMRPQKLTAKNALFAGSDSGARSWAIVASLIETCKLNGVEPFAYLKDILQRMVAGHPINRLSELLPWSWNATTATATAPPSGP